MGRTLLARNQGGKVRQSAGVGYLLLRRAKGGLLILKNYENLCAFWCTSSTQVILLEATA